MRSIPLALLVSSLVAGCAHQGVLPPCCYEQRAQTVVQPMPGSALSAEQLADIRERLAGIYRSCLGAGTQPAFNACVADKVIRASELGHFGRNARVSTTNVSFPDSE